MHIVVIKYIQLFCLTVFVTNNINCDQLMLQNEREDRTLYFAVSCTANCLRNNSSECWTTFKLEINFHTRNNPNVINQVYTYNKPLEGDCQSLHYTDIIESLSSCYEDCFSRGQHDSGHLLINASDTFTLRLLCRDDTSLTLEVVNESAEETEIVQTVAKRRGMDFLLAPSNATTRKIKSHSSRFRPCDYCLYLLKVQETGNPYAERTVYLSNSSMIEITNLDPNRRYNISGTIINRFYEYAYVGKIYNFSTLKQDYTPIEIKNFHLERYETQVENHSHLNALITWQPTTDYTCFYEIMWYLPTETFIRVKNKDINETDPYYQFWIPNLPFGSNYTVSIRGKNIKDSSREPSHNWIVNQTPTCLEWFNNSLEMCAPPVPNKIESEEEVVDNNVYNINVTWEHPLYAPDYYIVNISDSDESTTLDRSLNVSGDSTWTHFANVRIVSVEYIYSITSHSAGGSSVAKGSKFFDKNFRVSDNLGIFTLILLTLTPIALITVTGIVAIVFFHRRAKLKRTEKRRRYFEDLEQKAPIDPNSNFDIKHSIFGSGVTLSVSDVDMMGLANDKLEVRRDQVTILGILGEGAFGLVRKGIVKLDDGTEKLVAVKMLKKSPNSSEIKEFKQEIEVMKSVGAHPNIVGLIGHCTRDIHKMMLLTEFCSKGNLLNYLRVEWVHMSQIHLDLKHQENGRLSPTLTPALEKQKCPESIFNFDTSFGDKTFRNYKNVIEGPDHYEKIPTDTEADEECGDGTKVACTSACRCFVEILEPQMEQKDANLNDLNTPLGLRKCTVKIKDCECNHAKDCVPRIPNAVENRSYNGILANGTLLTQSRRQSIENSQKCLTKRDLLYFARQVAVGMEFLACNKVVHRDLAARNVLVCENNIVKISDFGLSRDVYQENMYKKTGNGKLPIKWLALESLTHQVYTSQSDVWSYGVLLYEILTLGGNPYPSIPTNRLLKLLKSGYRMEKPGNCGPQLYELMLSCWMTNPHDRPNFSSLLSKLDLLMAELPEDELIDPDNLRESKGILLETLIVLFVSSIFYGIIFGSHDIRNGGSRKARSLLNYEEFTIVNRKQTNLNIN